MNRHPLLAFFVLANLISWLAWAPLAATGLGLTTIHFSPYLHLLGGFGPLLAAIIVTAQSEGRVGLQTSSATASAKRLVGAVSRCRASRSGIRR